MNFVGNLEMELGVKGAGCEGHWGSWEGRQPQVREKRQRQDWRRVCIRGSTGDGGCAGVGTELGQVGSEKFVLYPRGNGMKEEIC